MTKPTADLAMTEEELKLAGHGDPNQDGYALLKLCVGQAMAQGRVRPELADADRVTQLFWAGVHGVASLHIVRPDDEQWCAWAGADVLAQEMIDLVFRGTLQPGDPALAKPNGAPANPKAAPARPKAAPAKPNAAPPRTKAAPAARKTVRS
jgi:pyruvate/2-oxoglutarate dehydrogenase complex dihydrolipoamide acyltransferase (E2) component